MNNTTMIQVHTAAAQGDAWLQRYQGDRPTFACVLGFTETGLIPGISAAGQTPADRRTTAIADAEFLVQGVQPHPVYPLPPLTVGASPTFISRAIVAALALPTRVFNAGLPQPPAIPHIDLGGQPAHCLSQGQALPIAVVETLFQEGMAWGEQLATTAPYLLLGECVVGGTTTALAVLIGLGYPAWGRVNSSHGECNHAQKQAIVQAGLAAAGLTGEHFAVDPLQVVARVGDPMQCVVSGMMLGASRHGGVLLAGGTQMLAVYALGRAIATAHQIPWQPEQVVVGTTRWVVADPSGDTVGLAMLLGDVPLLSTGLNLATSQHPSLQAYEAGFVKEGVGAGGCAIAATLYRHWTNADCVQAIDQLVTAYQHSRAGSNR